MPIPSHRVSAGGQRREERSAGLYIRLSSPFIPFVTMTTPALIADVGHSYQNLFCDDLEAARDAAAGNPSPFHLTAMGLISFLEGAIGLEHGDLQRSLQLLGEAEVEANAMSARKDSKSDALAGRVLASDALLSQGMWSPPEVSGISLIGIPVFPAVVHIFLESYPDMMKVRCRGASRSSESVGVV